MQTIALKFPDLHKLWEFRLEIDIRDFNVNGRTRTLSCRCNENHVHLALKQYNATLIQAQPAYHLPAL